MEYSYTYRDTMKRFVGNNSIRGFNGCASMISTGESYPAILTCEIKDTDCEIPTIMADNCGTFLENNPEGAEIVAPLTMESRVKTCAGAETALKYWSQCWGRLFAIISPKGERYYGNKGIILDSKFTPLFLSTITVDYNRATGYCNGKKMTIYLHPEVFTNDTGFINKSLAKKGIAFFLDLKHNYVGGRELPIEVVINDISKFIVKPHKPDIATISNSSLNDLAKTYIDDVLSQFIDDAR